MTPTEHKRFLRIAAEFSKELSDHIKHFGPVNIPSRKHLGLAQFLARVIIGQQLSTKAARTIWTRIEAASRDAGERIPQFFRIENTEKLRACGASGNKAKALIAIADAHADNRIAAATLRRRTPEQRYATLISLHGVGQWTVDMAAIFYFGDTDVWPGGDLSVSKTFESYLNKRQAKKVDSFVERFAPNRSYLAYYMYQIADGVPS